MRNNEENNSNESLDQSLMYQIPETLLGEFLDLNQFGDKQLTEGLELMFKNYFKTNRYFDQEATEAVLEAFHFCNYLIANKELFNSKNVA